MIRRILVASILVLWLLFIPGCNNGPKQPSKAEQERIEKEYQQEIEKMRNLTERGVTDTLNGKKPAKASPTPRMKP